MSDPSNGATAVEAAVEAPAALITAELAAKVRAIIDGAIAHMPPEQPLSAASRIQLVGLLIEEGYSHAEMAMMLGVSERTITRDRMQLRAEGAAEPTLQLGDQIIGEFERLTQSVIAQLRRISRDTATPAYARVYALESATRVYRQFVDIARRMGYTADARHRIRYLQSTDADYLSQERRIDRAAHERVLADPTPQAVRDDPFVKMANKHIAKLEEVQAKRREK